MARNLGQSMRIFKSQFKEETETDFDEIDWKRYDPRQYDPRRIIKDALADPVETGSQNAAESGFSIPGTSGTSNASGQRAGSSQDSVRGPHRRFSRATAESLRGLAPTATPSGDVHRRGNPHSTRRSCLIQLATLSPVSMISGAHCDVLSKCMAISSLVVTQISGWSAMNSRAWSRYFCLNGWLMMKGWSAKDITLPLSFESALNCSY